MLQLFVFACAWAVLAWRARCSFNTQPHSQLRCGGAKEGGGRDCTVKDAHIRKWGPAPRASLCCSQCYSCPRAPTLLTSNQRLVMPASELLWQEAEHPVHPGSVYSCSSLTLEWDSRLQCYWLSGPSLLLGWGLWCRPSSIPGLHLPDRRHYSLPRCDNSKCVQTQLYVCWGAKPTMIEDLSSEVSMERICHNFVICL